MGKRLITQRRGSGTSLYRSPSHRHVDDVRLPAMSEGLSNIPEGTLVHNVEARPGDGGKFVKTAGSSGTVVSRGDKVMVLMPSGAIKEFSPDCRAAIGVVAGGGRGDKPLAKAGKNVHTLRSRSTAAFKTKGVAMNPVDHPHGGGSHAHVGGPNCQKRTASPGQKVGFLPPKKKIKK